MKDADLLLIAALLHDVGKALPGDHSEVGADPAARLCRRIGFDSWAEPISFLVRNHLFLAETATQRDTKDLTVVASAVEHIGNARNLRMLYLLTIADSKATGKAMWTAWKSTLLRSVLIRLMERLEPTWTQADLAQRIEDTAALSGLEQTVVAEHIEGMGDGFLDANDNASMARHLAVANSVRGDISRSLRRRSVTHLK